MTHEERIARSEQLVAQMEKCIQETKEKLKRLDDKDVRSLPSLLEEVKDDTSTSKK